MATNDDETHPLLGATASAALGAAGEAAAFIAGAPIAGTADSTIGLSEAVATREAKIEEEISGVPGNPATRRWIWLAIAVVVVVVVIGLIVGLA